MVRVSLDVSVSPILHDYGRDFVGFGGVVARLISAEQREADTAGATAGNWKGATKDTFFIFERG